jgi:hypothetical protein
VSVVSLRRPASLGRATPRRSRIRLRGLALALALAGPAPAADPGAEAHPLSFGSRASKAAAKLGEPFDYVVEVRHRTEEWYALPEELSIAPFHAEGARCRRDERKEEAVTTCTMRLALFALGPVDVPDLALRVRTPAGPASLNVPGPRVTGTGVIDPAIPPEELALRDIAPPAPLLLRSLRLIWWALGTAAAAALLFLAARALRRARAEREATPQMPAAERFARRLDALEAEGLLERGEGRELVARLSVIVREYLGALTGLNALDLTTGELVGRLEGDPRLDAVGLEVFLREADLVKFARQAAGREACAAVMAYARGLLERTRPPHPGS